MKNLKQFLLILICCGFQLSFANPVSLREKIGQMLMIGIEGKNVEQNSVEANNLIKNNIGGVILFNSNISSPSQVTELNQQLQNLISKSNKILHRPHLPLLIAVDYEGGRVTRLEENLGFPPTLSAQQMGKLPLKKVHDMSKKMANTLKSSAFNLDFAPVTDVNSNPENPIIGKKERSFSDNPEQVVRYAHEFSKSLLTQHIQCAYKHFPGHGSSRQDSHEALVDVTDTWQKSELIPYQRLLTQNKHCGVIMTAHIINRKLDRTGLPATLSHRILTDLLRHKLHFKGVIITDDMQMNAISHYYGLETAITMAINAGADMLTFGGQLDEKPDFKLIIDTIKQKVLDGEITEARINQAYQHIVRLKKTLDPIH